MNWLVINEGEGTGEEVTEAMEFTELGVMIKVTSENGGAQLCFVPGAKIVFHREEHIVVKQRWKPSPAA